MLASKHSTFPYAKLFISSLFYVICKGVCFETLDVVVMKQLLGFFHLLFPFLMLPKYVSQVKVQGQLTHSFNINLSFARKVEYYFFQLGEVGQCGPTLVCAKQGASLSFLFALE